MIFHDPSINSGICVALEAAINKALKYDPGTQAALNDLAGTRIKCMTTNPNGQMYLVVDVNQIHISCDNDDVMCPVDVGLSGECSDLVALMTQHGDTVANSSVQISGRAQLLNRIQELAGNIDIDWEDALCEHLGSIAGHQIAKLMRLKLNWGKRQIHNIKIHLADYLSEEIRVIPSEPELNTFYDSVDALKSQLERCDARVQWLHSQIAHKNSPSP